MKKLILIMLLAVFSTFLKAETKVHKDREYLSFNVPLTWWEAVSWSEFLHMEIVVPRSPEELQWLRSTYGSTRLTWVGFDEYNGSWTPLDCTPLTYSFFGAHDTTALFKSGVTFNNPGSRGYTKGEYSVVPKSERHYAIFYKSVQQ